MFSKFSVSQLKQSKIAAGIAFVFLCLILLPLFIIAHFNYPCTDDFSFAKALYIGINNGSSFKEIIYGAWEGFMQFYTRWQGRYFDDIVGCFGFGIALPEYYFLGTYLIIILFVTADVSFLRTVTYRFCRWDSDISWIFSVIITAMQILYVPYASEAFYWYVGAAMYTIAYALLLFLGVALFYYYRQDSICGRMLFGVVSIIITFMIAGSNYATGLLTAEVLALVVLVRICQKKKWGFVGIILSEYLICFLFLNALAPSNAGRMGAVESLGVGGSILASLKQGSVFLKEWFRWPVVFLLIFIFLLGIRQMAEMNFSFPFPGGVTIISFGLFCSMMTPPFFAGATWGPGRLINLVYFSYYFLLAGNLLYWGGWGVHRYEKFYLTAKKEFSVLPLMFCFFVLLLICLKMYGLQSTSSSSALLSLVKGEAEEYLMENRIRWKIYEDDSVKDVEIEDFSIKPYVLYHDDVVEDESDWRNTAVAAFFGKDSVRLKK